MNASGTTPPAAVCMGEILIDFMAAESGVHLTEAETFKRKPGGAPANVAVGLRRLGVASAFVGMVGDDAFGEVLRGTLETDNVDTRSLATCTTQPTTLAFVSVGEKGVPSFSFYRHPGADLSLRPEDIEVSVFEQAQVFHFGSLSLVDSPGYDATWHALKLAREHGAFVTYDPNFRPALWADRERARARMLEPLGAVDLLKVSEEELALLSGTDDIEAGCATLAGHGPRHIMVTQGAEGLSAWTQGALWHVPSASVEVVDTTGCGDASMAGIITDLLRRHGRLEPGMQVAPEKLRAAMRYGNRCAGITATRLGAIPALPRAEEVPPEDLGNA